MRPDTGKPLKACLKDISAEPMTAEEKLYNGLLLDHLHCLQRLDKIAKKLKNTELTEVMEEEKRFVMEKLSDRLYN